MDGRSSCARRRIGAAALLLTTALSGCAGSDYGSAAWDPVLMPGTAEVAARTRYLGYNYLRPTNAYGEAVAARIDELAQAPMTEAAAIEVALLQDHGVRQRLTEHWAQRPAFVAAVAEATGNPEDPRPTEWRVLAQILAKSPTGRWEREFGAEYVEAAGAILDRAAQARVAY